MQKQPVRGGTTTLVNQPTPKEIRKKNAWWRKPKNDQRRQPYVISEGEVWYGCKVLGGQAWVWLEQDAVPKVAANESRFKGGRR